MRQRLVSVLLAAAGLVGCGSQALVEAPSRNQNSRVNYIVLHFTTENFADSLALLTQPSNNPVSSHYLIPESGDPTYPNRRLRVHKLVDENRRAWHAGLSAWGDRAALNDQSIGIELVNRSHCFGPDNETPLAERLCVFPDYDPKQIKLLIDLLRGILDRHPNIDPVDVVAHSDIAPERKVDPGPRFPWQALYSAGIGAWYEQEAMLSYWQRFETHLPSVATQQRALAAYGYGLEASGVEDDRTRAVIRAFQMHFVPDAVSGTVDRKTAAILFALIERYRGEQLAPLLAEMGTEQ